MLVFCVLALAGATNSTSPARRRLAPEDFASLNALLSRVSVTLPTLATSAPKEQEP